MGNIDPVRLSEMTKGQFAVIAHCGQVAFFNDEVPAPAKQKQSTKTFSSIGAAVRANKRD